MVAAGPPPAVGLVCPLAAEWARAGETVPDRDAHGVGGLGQRLDRQPKLSGVGAQPGGGVPEQDLGGQQIGQGRGIVRRILLAGNEPELGVDGQGLPGLGDHLPPAGLTRRGLGPDPGRLPVVEQLEHRIELLVGLERPVLYGAVREMAAHPAVGPVAAEPQPAQVLGNHGKARGSRWRAASRNRAW